jgi:hypothetical protein
MLLLRPHRAWMTLPLLTLLLGGCLSTAPLATNGPSASIPVEFPTGPLPTIPPTDIPLVTASPAPGTTLAPTDAPTDNPHPNWPPGAIGGGKAQDHVGEVATVCGHVDATNWLYDQPGHPTWLNFNHPYPDQRFNALIWGEQRRAWPHDGKPEVVYLDKDVCVTGLVESYSTWTQIQDLTINDIQVVSP